ncbi:molecular chaperone SurA [Oleiphilus sp. HI0123]|nr:molecular chaperone SurA [Oleiphilus sp. HI0123]
MFTHTHKKSPSILSLLFSTLLGLSCMASVAHAEENSRPELRPNAVLLDKVIAIVDDDIVMQSELAQRVNSITKRLQRQNTPLPSLSVMRQRVLDQLILESIQLQMANRTGIRIGDAQLNTTLENIARSNNMTLSQFEAQLELEGDTYASAREQIHREMVISRVQKRQVDQRVRVTEQEVQAFLASKEGRTQSGLEYLIGHILIALPESADKEQERVALDKANNILKELKAGEDFQKTAVAQSDGRQALEGGVIGWRKESELPTIAADIIPSLAIQEPSSLIRTGSGFHIVTVLDKRGGQEKLIEQSQVRHILISPSEIRTEEEAKEIIYKLHERLLGGDDFAAIAKSNSDDPASAIDGGNLDWVNPGQMVPAFEQTMTQTNVGELSEPFRSQFGWHILQVTERRVKDMAELIQNNQAQQTLHRRKFEEELSNWLLEIKGEAYIEIKEEFAEES